MVKTRIILTVILALSFVGNAIAGVGGGTRPGDKDTQELIVFEWLPVLLGGGDGGRPGDKD